MLRDFPFFQTNPLLRPFSFPACPIQGLAEIDLGSSETGMELGSRRDHKHSPYRLSVKIGTRGRDSRGFINCKDGKDGETRKENSDNGEFGEFEECFTKSREAKKRTRKGLAVSAGLQVMTDQG